MKTDKSRDKVSRLRCGSLNLPRILAPATEASRLALSAIVADGGVHDRNGTDRPGLLAPQLRKGALRVHRLRGTIQRLRGSIDDLEQEMGVPVEEAIVSAQACEVVEMAVEAKPVVSVETPKPARKAGASEDQPKPARKARARREEPKNAPIPEEIALPDEEITALPDEPPPSPIDDKIHGPDSDGNMPREISESLPVLDARQEAEAVRVPDPGIGERNSAPGHRRPPVKKEKVSGSTGKRQVRSEAQIEPPPPPPQLVKVIRRRAEQAPKVFETMTTTFPKSMLEGIRLSFEEENEG